MLYNLNTEIVFKKLKIICVKQKVEIKVLKIFQRSFLGETFENKIKIERMVKLKWQQRKKL